MGWYSTSWKYRVRVRIDHTKVPADATGFPVYVDLSHLPAGFFSNVKSDGSDIRVTKSDGVTEVPREVVAISTGGSTGELHFKGDLLTATDVDFWIYYGNSAASEPAVGATYGRNNVWTAYKNVYHLQTTGMVDSAGLQDGTDSGTATATGKVGGGLDFQTTDFGNLQQGAVHYNTICVSAWVKPSAVGADQQICSKGYDGANTEWQLQLDPTGKPMFGTYNGVQIRAVYGSALSNGTFYKVDGKYDGSNYSVNVNAGGSKVSTASATNPVDTVRQMVVGAISTGASTYVQNFAGVIDELRISQTAHSDNWLTTEYNNMNSPSTFYTVGTQSAPAPEQLCVVN